MVDAVLAAARRATLQSDQLREELRVIEKVRLAGVQDRNEIAVQVRFGFRCRLIGDAVYLEAFARPLACVTVANNLRDAIGLQQRSVFADDILRAEGWLVRRHSDRVHG